MNEFWFTSAFDWSANSFEEKCFRSSGKCFQENGNWPTNKNVLSYIQLIWLVFWEEISRMRRKREHFWIECWRRCQSPKIIILIGLFFVRHKTLKMFSLSSKVSIKTFSSWVNKKAQSKRRIKSTSRRTHVNLSRDEIDFMQKHWASSNKVIIMNGVLQDVQSPWNEMRSEKLLFLLVF